MSLFNPFAWLRDIGNMFGRRQDNELVDELRRRAILDAQAITARDVLERQAQLARDTVVQLPSRRRRPF